MSWTKLGKIFDPRDHALANSCVDFAQSPQALVFDEFVRIYFSTRQLELRNGKYLSHIAYVDMEKDFKKVIGVSDHTVVPLGSLGAFDEHGIFPMNVLRRGDEIHGYTCGWSRRVSVSVETSIGLVVSRDGGHTFQRFGDGPILSASLREPCLVGDGFVRLADDILHMWYIFGTGWRSISARSAPDRTYKIGHAISRDGIHWTKEEGRQIISDCLGPDECQALPTVVDIGDRFHMFFCYRETFDFRGNPKRSYRIGHAWSDDLANWQRDDNYVNALQGLKGEWDSEMQCYPHAFKFNERTYLLYNGNEFGRFGFGLAVLDR